MKYVRRYLWILCLVIVLELNGHTVFDLYFWIYYCSITFPVLWMACGELELCEQKIIALLENAKRDYHGKGGV